MHTALLSASKTLAFFLESCLQSDATLELLFDSGHAGHMVVSLSTPEEMRNRNETGLSIWLYRVARDDLRSNDPPTRLDRTHVMPPPLPLRLHYLITPIAAAGIISTSENEQLILGKAMQCLHTRPILRGADLRDGFEGTDAVLHVRLESLALDEITRVWDALDASYQLSLSYEVSVVNIVADQASERIVPVDVALPVYAVASPLSPARP